MTLRFVVGGADLLLFIALVVFGVWCVASRPWGLDAPSAASLAGALFGGAAVLLGNWINRANERHRAVVDRAARAWSEARRATNAARSEGATQRAESASASAAARPSR
jgi:hypothetical protein